MKQDELEQRCAEMKARLTRQKLEATARNQPVCDRTTTPPKARAVRQQGDLNRSGTPGTRPELVAQSRAGDRATGQTIASVPSGVYKIEQDAAGIYLQGQNVISDNIVHYSESPIDRIMKGIGTFWTRRGRYEELGLIYKRGVLLWGPSGSGKTVALNLMMKKLIDLNCVVLLWDHLELPDLLQRIRQMEPERPIIVVLEDIDEMIDKHGEHSILSVLDGENQIDNVVYLTTTNIPEALGARIVNRPNRFDDRVFVGMPSSLARKTYLKFAASQLDETTLELWTTDTANFSIGQLRELVASVRSLNQPYDEVMKELKSRPVNPKADEWWDRIIRLAMLAISAESSQCS